MEPLVRTARTKKSDADPQSAAALATPTRILRESSVRERIPVDPSTLWRWEQRGIFPRRVKIGPHAIGWYEHEVDQWLRNRAEAR
jgi:prophage regulatory protein